LGGINGSHLNLRRERAAHIGKWVLLRVFVSGGHDSNSLAHPDEHAHRYSDPNAQRNSDEYPDTLTHTNVDSNFNPFANTDGLLNVNLNTDPDTLRDPNHDAN
jgi:hypothetical protein